LVTEAAVGSALIVETDPARECSGTVIVWFGTPLRRSLSLRGLDEAFDAPTLCQAAQGAFFGSFSLGSAAKTSQAM
jgi:hypothetical protein